MATREQVKEIFKRQAIQDGLDVDISLAQIQRESDFNERAHNASSKAAGAAQFIPGTWVLYGIGSPYDPIAAARAWSAYMRKMLAEFGGRYDLALAGYNSGENRPEYRQAFRENREINWSVLPSRVQSETQAYVKGILRAAGKGSGVTPVTPIPNAPPTVNNDVLFLLALAAIVTLW